MAEGVLGIGLLIFLAHFFTALFQRTHIPDVLLLTLLGITLGPLTHIIKPEDLGRVGGVMSTMALVIILFESGISLKPVVFMKALRPTVKLTLSTFFVTAAAGYIVARYVLGTSSMVGLMTGCILAGTSAAVVIALVKSLKIVEPISTVLVMESALGDVLMIVLLIGLIQGAVSGEVHAGRIVGSVFASLLSAGLIGVLGGLAWLLVLNEVRQFPNTAFTTLAYVMILYGISDVLGFSGGISALAFGATLINYDLLPLTRFEIFQQRKLGRIDQTDVSFFNEILFLLKTFFFVYLGVSIRFEDWQLALYALAFTLSIYLARLLLVRFTIYQENASWLDLSMTTVMVPKGLVSAVLASMPVEQNLPGATLVREFTYMVVFISILLTAVLLPLMQRSPVRNFYYWFFEGRERVEPPAGEPQPEASGFSTPH
ncbi:MAG: cation:proton antiporter [Bryobacteraceae bacterium]